MVVSTHSSGCVPFLHSPDPPNTESVLGVGDTTVSNTNMTPAHLLLTCCLVREADIKQVNAH